MRFTISKEKLEGVISALATATASRPIDISHAFTKVELMEDGAIIFQRMDATKWLSISEKVDSSEGSGCILIKNELLDRFVRVAYSDDITISTTEANGGGIVIEAGSSKINTASLNPADFKAPVVTEDYETVVDKLDLPSLATAINNVAPVTLGSDKDIRNINIVFSKDGISAQACDGKHLSVSDINNVSSNMNSIISLNDTCYSILAKVGQISISDPIVQLKISNSSGIAIISDSLKLICRTTVTKGKSDLRPQVLSGFKFDYSITVNSAMLLRIIKLIQASFVELDSSRVILLHIDDKRFRVTSYNDGVTKSTGAEDSIEHGGLAGSKAPKFFICTKPQYLTDLIRGKGEDLTTIEFGDSETKPIKITNSDKTWGVIMPMKIK